MTLVRHYSVGSSTERVSVCIDGGDESVVYALSLKYFTLSEYTHAISYLATSIRLVETGH